MKHLLLNKKRDSFFTTVLISFAILIGAINLKAQTATAPAAGDGSAGNPYQIATLDNLYWISQNSSSWDKYFKQTADINASSTNTWDGGAGFKPIGNDPNSFSGSYDGDNHTISNLKINRSTEEYVGLFGYTVTSVIKNIGLININVYGKGLVGALAGRTSGSDITNCYSTGSVSGDYYYVGGLIGDNAFSDINTSYSTCTVSGKYMFAGGLVGANNSSNIYNSYATGSVQGEDRVGGLAGANFSGTINNSYSTGSVTGTFSVGGFIGVVSSATTNNSYSIGSVTGLSSVGGLVGVVISGATTNNSFWDIQTSGQSTSADGTGKTTAEMKTAVTFIAVGWDDNTWNMGDGINNGYPYLDVQNPGGATLKASTAPSGSGISADPYLISSLDNLYWIKNNSSSWSSYFKQTTDIDASATSSWGGGGFSQIGNSTTKFSGTYDGNGQTISGLYINRYDNTGMFGTTSTGAVIKNLGLINVDITGKRVVGSLVGHFNGGTINNCYSTGSVTSTYFIVGGLVGANNGTISNSYSHCKVTGPSEVGGIAGENYGSIINCFSTGKISGGGDTGGLVGWNPGGSATNSFWDTETSGYTTSSAGTGKTTAEMKAVMTFLLAEWSSSNWNIGDGINDGYPYLNWQNSSGTTLLDVVAPSGAGLSGNPYLIASLENLFWVSQSSSSWSGYFKQTADIDASSTSTWDGGSGFTPIGNNATNFAGTYDGMGYTIAKLYIDRSATDYQALFGYVGTAGEIKNTGSVDVNIKGKDYSAGLVGKIDGTVRNSYATGSVDAAYAVGGLAGYNYEGSIINCYSTVDVTGSGGTIGGLVGFNYNGPISNSYATGSVGNTGIIGGLVGFNYYGTISNSYSTGSVSGTNDLGGLVGMNLLASVNNSFWDTQTSGQNASTGGTAKTTAEMKNILTFFNAGWDLETETTNGTNSYWDIDNVNVTINSGYPFLSWENGANIALSVSTPTVSIGAPSKSLTKTGPVTFNITYSNADNVNLTAGDITLNSTGTAAGTIGVTNGTTDSPTVTISSITGDGTLGISTNAGTSSNVIGIQDAGGGPSTTFTVDNTIPTITISTIAGDDIINATEDNSNVTISGTTNGAEDGQSVTVGLNGKTYNGTVNKNKWSVTIPSADVQALDNTELVTADVIDLVGNAAAQAVKDISHDASAPSGYSVTIEQSSINGSNVNSVAFIIKSAELNATFNYTFIDMNGDSVVSEGTIESVNQKVDKVDLSSLTDGSINLIVSLTDTAGNVGVDASDTKIKDTQSPDEFLVAIDRPFINQGNVSSVSFTLTNVDDGMTYEYEFGNESNNVKISGEGSISSTSHQSQGVDLSSFPDGEIYLTVIVTDQYGNKSNGKTVQAVKDVIAPTGSIGSPSLTRTNTGPVTFSVSYTNADSINLAVEDVILNTTGNADGAVKVVNGNTSNPEISISDISGWGTIGISIKDSVARDIAGNYDVGAGPSQTFIINDIPVLQVFDSVLTFTEGEGEIPIAEKSDFSDSSPDFAGGYVEVKIINNPSDDDRVYMAAEGLLSYDEKYVVYDGEKIGTINGGITRVVIDLNESSTPESVGAIIHNLTFNNVSGNPNPGQRAVEITFNDNDEDSAPVRDTLKINMKTINDQPEAENVTQAISYTEDDESVSFKNILVSDNDGIAEQLTAVFTLSDTATGTLQMPGGTYNPETGKLSVTDSLNNLNSALSEFKFMPALNNDKSSTIEVSIRDGGEDGTEPVTGVITLEAIPVNDAPVIAAVPNIEFPEDSSFTLDLSLYVSDPDNSLSDITWTVTVQDGTVVPAGMIVKNENKSSKKTSKKGSKITKGMISSSVGDPVLLLSDSLKIQIDETNNTVTFTGTKDFSKMNIPVMITASDGNKQSNEETAEVSVIPVNDPPQIVTPLAPLEYNEDEQIVLEYKDLYQYVNDPDNADSTLLFSFDYSGDHFTVTGITDTNITIQPLENWFGIDTVTVIVSDGELSTQALLDFSILSVNDLPEFVSLADTIEACGSESMQLDMWEIVNDVETPDEFLNFEFTSSSDTLTVDYDAETGLLNLSTPASFGGKIELSIKVTDADNGSTDTSTIYSTCVITSLEALDGLVPEDYVLEQNYPNPFNPTTTIRYGLPEESNVKVMIYNLLGQLVTTLTDEVKKAGYYEDVFDAGRLASGIYLVSIYSESTMSKRKYSTVKKMMLIK